MKNDKISILVALLFAACSPPDCESKNGFKLYGIESFPQWSCEYFDHLERRFTFVAQSCVACGVDSGIGRGWAVDLVGKSRWIDSYGRDIDGSTECETRVILVGVAKNESPRDSSFVHEAFHAADNCTDHERWKERGIYQAIEAAKL